MTTVEMSAPYLSLELLANAIAKAVTQANGCGGELQDVEETLAAAVTWKSKLRELAESRDTKGHDWTTLSPRDGTLFDADRDVFFVEDLNRCEALATADLRFVVVTNEREQRDVQAGYAETVLNGNIINWRYWVEQMPTLSAGEAARLMSGLDPDLYADLNARPVPKNRVDEVCKKAASLERLARAEGKERDTPAGWLEWAKERTFRLHGGFETAVSDRVGMEAALHALNSLPPKEAARWQDASKMSDGRRVVTYRWAGLELAATATLQDFIEDVTGRLTRWKEGRYRIKEAAQVYADAVPEVDAVSFRCQMESAARSGELKVRRNGIPLVGAELPRGAAWNQPVLEKDVNEWLAGKGAEFVLAYPYRSPLTAADGITYEMLLYERLQAHSQWTGGRMAPTDVVPLVEATKLASKHAGHEVTTGDFLRAAARGEIRIRAVCPRKVKMLPVRPGDVPREMEAGSYPDLPAEACEAVSITGKANWRTYDDFEEREEFGGRYCRFTRWKLPDGEPDLVTTLNECLVMGWDVHALADAMLEHAAGAAATETAPPAVERFDAPIPETVVAESQPTGPVFSMTRAALVSRHEHHWPTIQSDLKNASTNGLSKAKAGVRDWNESLALEWAKANNKLQDEASTSADPLGQAMRNLSSLPGRKNVLKG